MLISINMTVVIIKLRESFYEPLANCCDLCNVKSNKNKKQH